MVKNLIVCVLLMGTASLLAADKKSEVAVRMPSTFHVQNFDALSKQEPEATVQDFEVPDFSMDLIDLELDDDLLNMSMDDLKELETEPSFMEKIKVIQAYCGLELEKLRLHLSEHREEYLAGTIGTSVVVAALCYCAYKK